MFLRAVIIDDEQKGINALKLMIEKYVPDLKVVAQCTKADDGIDQIENYKPEIVFLDIQMPEMDGFELLEKLRWKNFHLVFTTAHQEYGLRALKNNAVDYLLKPVDQADLLGAIRKVKTMLAEEGVAKELNYPSLLKNLPSRSKKITVNSRSGVESIDLPDIICFESMSNYTQICLSDSQTVLSSKTLREFDQQVCAAGQGFMRVHNSYIVNLRKVSRYVKEQETIVMVNDQKIPLSKSRRDAFFEWLHL
jgi:two-component system LytT family response regulator